MQDSIIFKEVDDKLVAVDIETGKYFTFNGVGAAMIRLLREGLPKADIVARLAEAYEAHPEAIEQDLSTFEQELINKKLI
jgi:hypothetical protein